MKIAILDDYQDVFRTLECSARLMGHELVVHYGMAVDQIFAFAAGKPINALNPEVLQKK
jgi:hypothetical protein